MNHREKLLDVVRKTSPKNVAEIGVCNGVHSEMMLHFLSTIDHMLLVDCWEPQEEYESPENFQLYTQTNHFDKMHQAVCKRFEEDSRVEIVKGYSAEVSLTCDDESFDFIYIDACHKYECVVADLTCWFPKLKKGAYIGGDDYCDSEMGVKRAVEDFFTEHTLCVWEEAEILLLGSKTVCLEEFPNAKGIFRVGIGKSNCGSWLVKKI